MTRVTSKYSNQRLLILTEVNKRRNDPDLQRHVLVMSYAVAFAPHTNIEQLLRKEHNDLVIASMVHTYIRPHQIVLHPVLPGHKTDRPLEALVRLNQVPAILLGRRPTRVQRTEPHIARASTVRLTIPKTSTDRSQA